MNCSNNPTAGFYAFHANGAHFAAGGWIGPIYQPEYHYVISGLINSSRRVKFGDF